MNNNINNDPILDWILQGNLTEDNNSNSKPISTELLNLLLTQNVNVNSPTPGQPQQSQEKVSPETTSSSHMNTSSPSEEDDEPTDAQLKMMPSKERRQLRNKISARNFRNRRKEYVATLEKEMDQCKAENSQLKLEVKWVRGMMDKLQAENDRLRLELVLCKEGIQPSRNVSETLAATTNLTSSPGHLVNNTMASSNNTTTNSNNWEVAYPSTTSPSNTTSNTTLSTTSNNNVYLAHARLPCWDMSSIFEKNCKSMSTKDTDLIRTYPLLAPALMSIVINHTMTMTTNDIIANSTLYDPTWASLPTSKNDKHALTSLSESAMWLQTLSLQQQPQPKTAITETADTETTTNMPQKDNTQEVDRMTYFIENYCPLYWAQRQFCNFIISYVVVKYPHLDSKCRTYLPICEKFRQRKQTNQLI